MYRSNIFLFNTYRSIVTHVGRQRLFRSLWGFQLRRHFGSNQFLNLMIFLIKQVVSIFVFNKKHVKT